MINIRKIYVDDPAWPRVESLYESAFPPEERRPAESMCRLVESDELFVAAVERDGAFCGFITWWDLGDVLFGEHFAMLPECRGGGIGGEVIRRFAAGAHKPVLLEVEVPHDDISERRVGFYRRNGFELCEREYLQPPYFAGGEPVPMHLMSYGMTLDDGAFDRLRGLIYSRVYGMPSDK